MANFEFMKGYLIVLVSCVLISCGKNSVSPNVSGSNKADFSLSSHNYIKGEKVIFTNTSSGIITFDWYDNGISFNNTIKPSDQIFSPGNHIIELIGKTSDGVIFKHVDSFKVFDKFLVNDYKIKNNTNYDLKIDSAKGAIIGFLRTDKAAFGWWGYQSSIIHFMELFRDSAKNSTKIFTNNLTKPFNRIKTINSMFYIDLMDNCNFIYNYLLITDFNAFYNNSFNYNGKAVVKTRNANNSSILLSSGDFDIEIQGNWNY